MTASDIRRGLRASALVAVSAAWCSIGHGQAGEPSAAGGAAGTTQGAGGGSAAAPRAEGDPVAPSSDAPVEPPPVNAPPEPVPVPAPPAAVSAVAASASDAAPPAEGEKASPADEKNEKKTKKGGHKLKVKGRVIARADRTHRPGPDLDTFDLSVPSARIGAEYRSPMKWLEAEVELDIAGKPKMKDAFLQAKTKHFLARVGQFKIPVTSIEAESVWGLPVADRGVVHDLLTDWLDVGGRRPGALVGVRKLGPLKVGVYAGAFEGSVVTSEGTPGERQTDLLFQTDEQVRGALDTTTPSLFGRAEAEFAGVQAGASYEYRVGSKEVFAVDHYWTTGFDLAGDFLVGSGGVRAYADAIAGKGWYVTEGRGAGVEPTFLSFRFIGAYRFGGQADERLYAEPYGMVGSFDPDSEVVADRALELAFGVNVGFWKRARLTLEVQNFTVQRNFPLGSTGYFGSLDPERTSVVLQAGAAF